MMNKRRFTMYTKQPKKMIIINILDILKRYTDENHRLSQREIMDILEREYDMKVDRKAVKRNLMNLIDFGYQVEYSESIRQGKNGEEEIIFTDWYLEKDFTDSELRLLIDSLLFSKHIPYSQCKALIEKLEGLSNCYFKSRVKHIQTMPDTEPQNKQLFYTIEMLDKAIIKGRQVAFYYNEYHTDMKMYPRENEKGEKRRYIINPYQIAAINGRYYLICNYDKYDNVANYRLDRITDIEILPVPVKPMKKVKGLENGLNLPKHMAEHIYMFTGESAAVTFRAKKYLVSEIIDWFGKDIKFSDETEDEVTVRVMVNLEAIRYLEVVGMQKELIETISKMSELKSLTPKHCCLSSLRGLRNLGNLSELFIEDMGKDPGILEIFSIPSIERLKLFVPREYEQERTDWYLRSLKVNLPMLQWLELEMPAHEFHIETLEGLELRRFGVTSKRFEL